jgi:hypothetical protein
MLKRVIPGLLGLLLFVGTLPALAQSPLIVQTDRADLDFPNSITFFIKATSVDSVDEVYLEYGTNARSCVQGVARQEAELLTGGTFQASWEWDFKNSGSLPPGAEVWWQWEVRTAAGQSMRTERQTLVIEDPSLTWQRIENDQVLVVWSDGNQAFGRRILDLATRSLDELAEEAGLRPDGKVRLTIYPSFESLRRAALFLPEWTGGVAFPEYGVTILGIPVDYSNDWMEDVVPHELAHLVTGERVFNCLGVGIPTWLSEGLSVYSETPFSAVDSEQVQTALERKTLPPLRNLAGGFPANAEATTQAYAQSGEVVRYLIKEYGAENMAKLLATIQSGKRINQALQEVYGFDTDGLDRAWRAALGFTVDEIEQTAAPTPGRTAVPTLALWTSVVRPNLTATASPEGTATPAEVAAASSATPTPEMQTAAPTLTNQGDPIQPDGKDSAPGGQNPLSGLPCLGGSAAVLGIFIALALPATRAKRQRSLAQGDPYEH